MARFALVIPLLLAACSSAPPPPPAKPQPSVVDSQLKAMDKARGTGATLEQGKQKTDEALQKAEGG
jgi:hypothetical protein